MDHDRFSGPPQRGPVASRPHVFSVSELLRDVRACLERGFPTVWVSGEISNFSRPRSGHWYFTLKDDRGQLRCAMFRSDNRRLDFVPEDGMQVLVRGRLTLYEARGDFQMVVETLEEHGDGALQRAFERLKARLAAEGLFDEARKRPLPRLPRRIGVLTSPTGAAVHDILTVLRRRFPAVPVRIYPIPVQGEGAAEAIVAALELAGRRQDCDVLILARGGGSLEDLWAFNDERLARAIVACPIPVVTGIGHQTDFTIADFCADWRAPTPSAAAERVVPDRREWLARIDQLRQRLCTRQRAHLQQARERLQHLRARLRHPRQRLDQLRFRLDELEARLQQAQRHDLQRRRERLAALQRHLQQANPMQVIDARRLRLEHLQGRLHDLQRGHLDRQRQRLHGLLRALDAVSPLATLERGYAILQHPDGRLLREVQNVRPGDTIDARLHDGRLRCRVLDVEKQR